MCILKEMRLFSADDILKEVEGLVKDKGKEQKWREILARRKGQAKKNFIFLQKKKL